VCSRCNGPSALCSCFNSATATFGVGWYTTGLQPFAPATECQPPPSVSIGIRPAFVPSFLLQFSNRHLRCRLVYDGPSALRACYSVPTSTFGVDWYSAGLRPFVSTADQQPPTSVLTGIRRAFSPSRLPQSANIHLRCRLVFGRPSSLRSCFNSATATFVVGWYTTGLQPFALTTVCQPPPSVSVGIRPAFVSYSEIDVPKQGDQHIRSAAR